MEPKFRFLNREKNKLLDLISGRFIFKDFIFIPNFAAFIISLAYNKSLLWAIFHYFIGFWYLLIKATQIIIKWIGSFI